MSDACRCWIIHIVAVVWEAATPPPPATSDGAVRFRWTKSREQRPACRPRANERAVALTLSPGPNPARRIEMRAGDTPLARLPLQPGARDYSLLLPDRRR